jgi:DNA-binding response OmpR family regulator
MTTVLAIEDDPAILRGLCDNLRFEGYDVIAASDGETGYRMQRERKPDTRTVDNHVAGLRAKLERDAPEPEHIRTVHGVGYKFTP